MRPRHALPAAALAAVVLPVAALLGLGLGPGAPAPAALEVPAFRLVDSGADGSELNLGVAPNGHVFVGGWNAVRRSTNDGLSWTSLAAEPVPQLTFAADRVLVVDKDTGRVLKDDTYLGCTILGWSDDEGATWQHNPLACGGGVTDHQKVAVGRRISYPDPTGLLYPNVIYVCANGLAAANCGVSVDGGLTFLPTYPHGVGCAFQGVPVTDAAGVLYEPTSSCGAKVRVTRDNGLSWSVLDVGAPTSPDTPDVAVDVAGNLYYFHTDPDWRPSLARSTDRGQTWSSVAVPVPGLTSSALPAIVAGDAGRVALAFYGTTEFSGNPGDAPDATRWHGYVVVAAGAEGPSPAFAVARVTPGHDPLEFGCITKLGGCLDDIADYLDIDVGPDGRVYAVFTDSCPPGCDAHNESTRQDGVVVVQTGGPRLRG